jgi:hypothetical protein
LLILKKMIADGYRSSIKSQGILLLGSFLLTIDWQKEGIR